jgi:type III secretion system low calcium response chaperone LcrH/SycD
MIVESIYNQTHMSESNDIKLPKALDRDPKLKQFFADRLKGISKEKRTQTVENFKKFMDGELTWAEIKKVPKWMLKLLAKFAYTKFKMREYANAETMFKALAIVDHNNWYYRAGLGAVYQKQKKFDQAIDEYSIALTIKEDEVTSLVNRGECFIQLQDLDAAMEDFAEVIKLGLPKNNPWRMRAQILSQRVLTMKGTNNE